ncbi:ATP-binding protein [Singulisphaera acidiphila]|uniref:histidine kinase n=1 Tax=Singulisphaera acidiphila (strain ATCC BAA-1392 / DSM 18658 / VKM B-2454 / MOB10) TaxID=886293 RepID=L0DMJ5_SINAD|nr:ATP-binding protein [Singulisphaera acidiphila]AGA29876.1 histidine kinase [Singulisphaera acidiphila DSM 18658]
MGSRNDDREHAGFEDPAARLSRRYWGALAIVALLLVFSQVVVQPPTLRLLTDAPTINVAGRQRMLSQRIAKAGLAMKGAADEVERAARRDELVKVLAIWTEAHDQLRREESAGAADLRQGVELHEAFEQLEPFYERMRDAAASLLADDGDAGLAGLLTAETEYLPRMDRVVGLYEREAQAHVNRLSRVGWGVTALTLLALAGIGRFVLNPATDLIGRQVAALRGSRDEMEERVRLRTIELQRLNHDLAREVAERVRAEGRQRAAVEQFSHVARITAVGEMASGLAHELNQPLGAIANYTEGCLVALAAPTPALDEVRGVLERILATTLRAGAIVQRIRRFVTRHESVREPIDPNRLVRDVEEFLNDEVRRRGVTLTLDLARDLPSSTGDSVQIQQVLVNLLRNALDALSASQTQNRTVVIATKPDGDGGVEFRVTDNGEGIRTDRLDQIFDAYFSTRVEGMGMGLAISRTIVEAHHGRIRVESEPGVRTTFRFTLPASDIADEREDAEGEGGRGEGGA